MKRTTWTAMLLGATLAFLPPSFAQVTTSSDTGPALGVARISLINGDVSTQRGDSGDWVGAGVNTPVVEGDTVATGEASRAEVQLDYSNLLRMDARTEVQMASLGQRNFRVQLFNGRITYSELKGGEADVDIETPQAAIRPQRNGRYEIETHVGETIIQVRKGEAEVFASGGSEVVRKGRMLVVTDDGRFQFADARPRGEWDRWNKDRDNRLSNVDSYRYVSRSVTGAGDLDYYGDWRYVSGYGYTWYPRVNAGWAPYRNGRWGWTNYYGWTWIGYEPWGWAPYHYGRWWNHPAYGWGWYPGRRVFRQAWRPALVGFFGYGGRRGWSVNVGIGFGSVGWVPLAPGEVYYPWYGGRRGNNVRIKNSTIVVDNSVNIYNDYRNARVRNGATVVDADGFAQGRLNNVRTLGRQDLARASAVRGQVPVVPDRRAQGTLRSVRTATTSADRSAARRATFSRSGVRASARPRASRSFDQQRQQMATSVRQFRTTRASTTPRATTRATTGSTRVSGSVRSTTGRRTQTAPRATVRSGAAGSRAGSSARTSIRSGDRSARTSRSSPTFSAPQRSNRSSRTATPRTNTRGSSGVRSSSRSSSRATTSAPARSAAGVRSSGQPRVQQRNNTIDRGPVYRDRGSSRTTTAPRRSSSRVGSSPRSAPSSSRTPRVSRRSSPSSTPSASRIPRSSPSRTTRAPRQSRQSAPRMSRPSSAPRSAPRMSRPSSSPRSAPRMSSPSRSSAPRASRGGSAPRSSGSRGGGGRARGGRR